MKLLKPSLTAGAIVLVVAVAFTLERERKLRRAITKVRIVKMIGLASALRSCIEAGESPPSLRAAMEKSGEYVPHPDVSLEQTVCDERQSPKSTKQARRGTKSLYLHPFLYFPPPSDPAELDRYSGILVAEPFPTAGKRHVVKMNEGTVAVQVIPRVTESEFKKFVQRYRNLQGSQKTGVLARP